MDILNCFLHLSAQAKCLLMHAATPSSPSASEIHTQDTLSYCFQREGRHCRSCPEHPRRYDYSHQNQLWCVVSPQYTPNKSDLVLCSSTTVVKVEVGTLWREHREYIVMWRRCQTGWSGVCEEGRWCEESWNVDDKYIFLPLVRETNDHWSWGQQGTLHFMSI
jgi:hypothetical protein